MAFEATVRAADGVAVITLAGEIMATSDAGMHAAYDEAAVEGTTRILLNFADVTYINSTGIALVVSLLAEARKNDVQILACGLSDHYKEIFEITRLADFVSIFPDEASAITGSAR